MNEIIKRKCDHEREKDWGKKIKNREKVREKREREKEWERKEKEKKSERERERKQPLSLHNPFRWHLQQRYHFKAKNSWISMTFESENKN